MTPVERLRAAAQEIERLRRDAESADVGILSAEPGSPRWRANQIAWHHAHEAEIALAPALAAALLALLDAAEVGGCGCSRCNAVLDGIVSDAAAMLPGEDI